MARKQITFVTIHVYLDNTTDERWQDVVDLLETCRCGTPQPPCVLHDEFNQPYVRLVVEYQYYQGIHENLLLESIFSDPPTNAYKSIKEIKLINKETIRYTI